MRKKVLNIFILIVTLFLINFDGVRAEASTLTCKYTNEAAKTAATIEIEKGTGKNKIKITKFEGEKKKSSVDDLNEQSYYHAVNSWKCPETIAIVKEYGLFKVFSGTEGETGPWLVERRKKNSEAKLVLLKNTETISSIGYDGQTVDNFINAKTKCAASDEKCLELRKNCAASDDTCLEKQKELFIAARKINEQCKKIYADPDMVEGVDEYDKCLEFDEKYVDYAKAGYFGNHFVTSTNSGCTETLGVLGEWLTRIYKILLLAVPVIIMVFGFKDFMKAILNGKEDELKKAGSTFIKRLIFGAVFVALPIFIKVILSLALGGSFSDICIL